MLNNNNNLKLKHRASSVNVFEYHSVSHSDFQREQSQAHSAHLLGEPSGPIDHRQITAALHNGGCGSSEWWTY